MSLQSLIDLSNLPEHIAIIMDGNGRWAKQKGKERIFGHKNGVAAVRETTEAAAELGVKYLTLYAFSTENWTRPKLEVNALMTLLVKSLKGELKTLNKNNIRLTAIGDLSNLPKNCQKQLAEVIEETKENTRMVLNLALNYSGKWDLEQSMKKIAKEVENGSISSADVNADLIASQLSTYGMPDPEFMIRTSGESRLSNFLLWQLAYAEFYFAEVLWPDFRKDDFYHAILSYQKRERRFGKTGDQIKQLS